MKQQSWIVAAQAIVMGVALSACGGNSSSMPKAQPQKAAEINLELGLDYYRKGKLEQAKEKIDRAVSQDPRNAKAQAAAGLLYDRLGEQRKSESHFDRAISLDGKNPEIRNNYAVVLCQHKEYDKGEKMALAALADPLYKTPEMALMNAANCRLSANDREGAEKHFRALLQRRPRYAPALFQMAEIEFEQNNLMSARAFYDRFIEAARPSAQGLLLGYRIESRLGNQPGADNYARRLRKEFPNAAETRQLDSKPTG